MKRLDREELRQLPGNRRIAACCPRECMNPYALLASEPAGSTRSVLASRLAAWHDAMVAHERRLRTGRTDDLCDEDCPHVEARALWAEALDAFGVRAHELSFLRSRAAGPARPAAATGAPLPGRLEPGRSDPASTVRATDRERKGFACEGRTRPALDRPRHALPRATEAEP